MVQTNYITKLVPPSQSTAEYQEIPRIIWQTFESSDVPSKMYEAAQSWVEYNPDYEYRFHDKDDRIKLIQDNLPEEFVRTYHLLENGTVKADFWRHCTLYLNGGVYADIDTVCQRPLSKLIKSDDRYIVPTSPVDGAVFTAFVCAAPRHPFTKKLLDRSVELILSGSPIKQSRIVGPIGLGLSINLTLGREEKHIFEEGRYCENDISFRILRKILKKESSTPRVMDGDEIVCLNKYDGYVQDLESMSIEYWQKADRKKRKQEQK